MRLAARRAALTLACLGFASALVAQDPSSQIEEARRLYREGRFDEAVHDLQEIIPRLENGERTQEQLAWLADAYLNLGLAYAALGEVSTAQDAFENAIQLSPDSALDRTIYAPKVVRLFEQARLAVSALEPVAVRGRPGGRLRRGWELRLEQGGRSIGRVHLGGAPAPAFFDVADGPVAGEDEAFYYMLPLPSRASGSGGIVNVGLTAPRPSLAFDVRYSWAQASDHTAPPSHANTNTAAPFAPPAADGREEIEVRWLDVLWTPSLVDGDSLGVRLEVGYRHQIVEQRALDLMRDLRCDANNRALCARYAYAMFGSQRPPTAPVFVRREQISHTSETRNHGLHVGGRLDVEALGPLHFLAHGAFTAAKRRATDRVDWAIADNPEVAGLFEKPLTLDVSSRGTMHLALEIGGGLGLTLGRHWLIRATYQLTDCGPESPAASGGRLMLGSASLTLSYRTRR